ncbi:hypothetical protein ACEWY4_025375 [Coilia grayii]|uniref:Endosome-associated-trafficking regulator 1 n=1 Tax=Coilia grayii TaxID=363190 RepID=A0ABD1IXH5_9TELE
MSKFTRLAGDGDPQENEESNPFSYKEFIKSKEQHLSCSETLDAKCNFTKKNTSVSAHPSQRDYSLPARGFDQDQDQDQPRYFSNSVPQTYTETSKQENDNFRRYQPEITKEPNTFGFCGIMDRTACSDAHPFTTPSYYEADEETSTTDPLHRTCSIAEYGNKGQLKLKEENAKLRKHVKELIKKSEVDDQRIRQLTAELQNKKAQDEQEAKALEAMVHSVEQNLQLMTKRAIKAESIVTKLKQEIHQLQDQLEGQRGELASMKTMKHNAQVASEYLSKATHDAETSIKQLLTGAETLCLVSQMLNSIDKITENIT